MLKLGTFIVDCTPPVGCGVLFGIIDATTSVRDPLLLRGFVLDDEGYRCLIATMDFCGLMNSAYDDLVRTLAKAANAPEERVIIHCIHQHDAPLLNYEIEAYLNCETYPMQWWTDVLKKCAQSAAECLDRMVTISSLGYNETRLHGYASNRRILGFDGKVVGMRFSKCSDTSLRNKPVGVIDPMLRTVAFKDSSGKIAGSLSFYATHPQVSNGRNMYSADAPGEALNLLEGHLCDGLHGFFTGAGGNVTAGKYSSATDKEGNLLMFGKILADGISLNLGAMKWEDARELHWHSAEFPFPAQQMDKDKLLSQINDESISHQERLRTAVLLTCLEYEKNTSYHMSLLRMGSVKMLFLPGELFVEYQLYAQSLIPDEFLAVASNCSDNFLYLPLAKHFEERGYEFSFCWCTTDFERRFKKALPGVLSR
ncbi:hypothetical protein ACFLQR_01160 [Verrucomicrobiota bacterium]